MAPTSKDKGVTTADVAALNGTPDETTPDETTTPAGDASAPIDVRYEDGDGTPFLSEGMRHDIFLHGSAVDPASGRRVVRA